MLGILAGFTECGIIFTVRQLIHIVVTFSKWGKYCQLMYSIGLTDNLWKIWKLQERLCGGASLDILAEYLQL